ncbi:unnamed protein product [Somion occarium]|uniref:RRM domain-containing protein n=1 Tax=Somion occarium TaxID=3059160 RepID=A0ABP1DJ77_9APHY
MSQQINDRVSRVACVDTNQPEDDVRRSLSSCGEIIYPWHPKEDITHFFVEFDHPSSVERARSYQSSTLKVYALADCPKIISRFSSLAAPVPSIKQESQDIPSLILQNRPKKRRSQRPARGESVRRNPYDDRGRPKRGSYETNRQEGSSIASSSRTYSRSPRRNRVSSEYMRDCGKENGQSKISSPSASVSTSMADAGRFMDVDVQDINGDFFSSNAYFPSTMPFPLSFAMPGVMPHSLPSLSFASTNSVGSLPTPAPSTPAPTLSPSIILSYEGGSFTCDLDALSEDPEGVIGVLRQTAANALERDKWMIVAGHYRGKGNILAALAVITVMIEVMTSPVVGIPERELKPAFLMLSSCHTDLAKRARIASGPEDDGRREHLRKAQECLQKVYGKNVPSSDDKPLAAPQASRGYLINAGNLQSNDPFATVQDDRTPTKSGGRTINDLERENQSLRDRHRNLGKSLSQANVAKRKAENDLDDERHLRRKAERDLAGVQQELSSARRSERFALEQCRREVENRRKAEERAAKLKDELVKVKHDLEISGEGIAEKERRARECFGRLGMIFLKAAKGETAGLEEIPGTLAAGSGSGLSTLDGFKAERLSVSVISQG